MTIGRQSQQKGSPGGKSRPAERTDPKRDKQFIATRAADVLVGIPVVCTRMDNVD